MTDITTVDPAPDANEPPPRRPLLGPDDEIGGSWLLTVVLGTMALIVLGFFGFIALSLASCDGTESAAGGGALASSIDVSLREFAIDGQLTAAAGDVTLAVTNNGDVEHNLILRGTDLRTPVLGPGGTTELVLPDLAAGTYELFCDVPGHEEAGMVNTLTVSEPAAEG